MLARYASDVCKRDPVCLLRRPRRRKETGSRSIWLQEAEPQQLAVSATLTASSSKRNPRDDIIGSAWRQSTLWGADTAILLLLLLLLLLSFNCVLPSCTEPVSVRRCGPWSVTDRLYYSCHRAATWRRKMNQTLCQPHSDLVEWSLCVMI